MKKYLAALTLFFATLSAPATAVTIAALLGATPARAGYFEVSAGFSFNESNYGDSNYSWTRRWGTSVGYHFTPITEIEASFQDVLDRNHIVNYEDTTFHDRIYSVNIVQSIFGKDALFDPYVKLGVGQLNRDATGTYAFGSSPYSQVDSLTVLVGVGVRIHLSQRFGLRGEASSYLNGGSIRTWQDNVAISAGFSVYF